MKRRLFAFLAALFGAHAAQPGTVLTGDASFYADRYEGRPMANGQPYNPSAFTLACNDLPLGTTVYLVRRRPDGSVRTAHATVTDRGPAESLRAKGRIFDLSYALFSQLDDPRLGVIRIEVRVLSSTPR